MAGSSDEEIEAAAIGGPTVHDGTIRLVEHDVAWADLFAREETRLRDALGPAALTELPVPAAWRTDAAYLRGC